MSGPRRPVPLRPGALRALLRQPDLPPDLVAKITERADDLTRAEQDRDASIARTVAWEAVLRRLPIALLGLVALAGVAGLAALLLPAPPETGSQSAAAPMPAEEPSAALIPARAATLTDDEPPIPADGVASAPKQVPTREGVSVSSAESGETAPNQVVRPSAPASRNAPRPGASKVARAARTRARSNPVPLKKPVAQPVRPAPAPASPPSPQAQSGNPVTPTGGAAAGAVQVPAVIPLVEVPPQP